MVQVSVVVPPLASGDSFDVRLKLSGSSSVSGPGGEFIEARVHLFSEPMGGTLTGAQVMSGNSMSELETNKGHYVADMLLKPIVQQFKLPPKADTLASDAEASAEADESGAVGAEAGAALDAPAPQNGADVKGPDGAVDAAGTPQPDATDNADLLQL